MKHLYKFGIFLFLTAATSISEVAARNILGIDGEESTSVGIYIKDLRTGRVLVDHNSRLALTPASVMKVITTASALSVLGTEHRFTTTVSLSGASCGSGQWKGNIVVSSSADPTVESEYFKERLGFCDSIADGIERLGIKSLDGSIIVEQTLSEPGPIAQWEIEDVAWPYGAGLFGFNWRDNCVNVTPATGQTKPYVPGLNVELRKSDTGNDHERGVGSDRLIVYARNPQNKKWVLGISVPDPSAVFKAELTEALRKRGIEVSTKKFTGTSDAGKKIYVHRSPPSAEIMRSLMVRSDNMFAEGMLRAIAPGKTRKRAIEREKEIWASRGISPRYTIIRDGSGLTRANRLSARFIGDVLEWMAESPRAATFTSFFPRAGRDGTLRSFLDKSPLEGQLALKTGSVSSVQCYAGYKIDNNACPTHVVVVMVNGFFCPRAQVRRGTERLMMKLFAPQSAEKQK